MLERCAQTVLGGSPMIRLSCLITAFFVLLSFSPVQAGVCFGPALWNNWQTIVDMQKAQAYEQSAPEVLKLADGGFAPAQLLLGRMYKNGLGVAPDANAAFTWLSLAKNRQLPLVDRELREAGGALSFFDRDAIRQSVESWRPKIALCEGVSPYPPPHFIMAPKVTVLRDQVIKWWGMILSDMLQRDPASGLYLMSVDTVLIAVDGPPVGTLRAAMASALRINQTLLSQTVFEAEKYLLGPVEAIINEQALMRMPTQAEETYKGRHIMLWPVGDQQTMMTQLKQGVDMVESLPKPLRDRGSQVKEIRYIPPLPFNAAEDANAAFEYIPAGEREGGGLLVAKFNPVLTSSASVAIGLVESSIWVQKAKSQHAQPESETSQGHGTLSPAKGESRSLTEAENCQRWTLIRDTAKAIELDATKLGNITAHMERLGCLR